MTRRQFLNDLYQRLAGPGGLSPEQAEQHLVYYAEMLADRIEEGMSEENAVASMEPPGVIAQRILQDEGGQNPQNANGFGNGNGNGNGNAPPSYPDLPETDGSRFSKVPKMPRNIHINGKKIGRVLLWVLAILLACRAVFIKLAGFNTSGDMSTQAVEAVDYAISEIPAESRAPLAEEWPDYDYGFAYDYDFDYNALWDLDDLHIGPDGIYGDNFSIMPGGIYAFDGEHEIYLSPDGILMEDMDTADFYRAGGLSSRYPCGGDVCAVAGGIVSCINIEWGSGAVEVRAWDGDAIQFQEFSKSRLSESRKLKYTVNNGTLDISPNGGTEKGLEVLIPQGIDSLNVRTSSSDIYWNGLSVGTGQASATSGRVYIDSAAADYLTAQSSSGGVSLRGVTAKNLEASATSGSIVLDAVAAEQADISASSGSVTGMIAGEIVSMETTSGKIHINAGVTEMLELDSSSGNIRASLENACPYMDASATSGDVTLVLPYDMGFTLEFDTSSGYLDKGSFPLVRSEEYYVCGSGGPGYVEVETSSGDLRLEAK